MTRLLIAIALVLFAIPSFALQVNLSWDASPSDDVAGYKLYYGSDPYLTDMGLVDVVDVGNVLEHTMQNLDGEQVWYFAATAYDEAGNESVYSNIVHSEVVDETPPLPPAMRPLVLQRE